MTRYEDLCQAWLKEEPRRLAIDRILRELPMRMRDAITAYLAPPSGIAQMPTTMYREQTAFVELYSPVSDQIGTTTWERCGAGQSMRPDRGGIYSFHIGICIEKAPDSLAASMIYFTFSVESFDDQFIELKIKNLDGSIRIDEVEDPTSYMSAAKTAMERLMDDLKNPRFEYWSRAPMGFTSAGNS